MAASNTALQHFDKGLRSQFLNEQLTTVSTLNKLLVEHPVPLFVNSMILRLAESFQTANNELRTAISRSLGQCGTHMTLAFSSAEIFRRVLVVSHSNDPNAREATLDFLASLAPLYPESGQTHHLICESLNTTYEGEFRAACVALKSFAQLSSSFSESIVPQISQLLEDVNVTDIRKTQLCDTFATMSANASTMERIFEISRTVLRRSKNDELVCHLLEATTSLCIEIRYAIPKQIDIFLDLLADEITSHSNSRRCLFLKELKRLASFSNIWTEGQMEMFNSILTTEYSNSCISEYFDVAIALSKNCSQSNQCYLKSLVISSASYASMPDPEISVRYVHLTANVLTPTAFEDDPPGYMDSTLTSLSVVVSGACSHGKINNKLANRLYRSIGDLLCAFPYTQYEFSTMIISAIFMAFDEADGTDNNMVQRLQLLCRLVDSDKIYINEIQQWACNMMIKKPKVCSSHSTLFSYLCLAIGTELPKFITPVFFKESPLKLYETAKSALRNGHWRSVALPNLERINTTNMQKIEGDWIVSLIRLAQSELTDYSLNGLEIQSEYLQQALSMLQVSKATARVESQFRFPVEMVTAMIASNDAFYHLLTAISPFLSFMSGGLEPGKLFNSTIAQRFVFALSTTENIINEAQTVWSSLCRSSFCADPTSLDIITQLYSRMSILYAAMRVALGKQSADTNIQLPPLSTNRTCTQLQQEGIIWAIHKIQTMKFRKHPTIETVYALHEIAKHFATLPFTLPRFFFHRFYEVDFKISITPSVEKYGVHTIPIGQTMPVRVDGAITSNHPSHIRTVIVYADVVHHTNFAFKHNHIESSTVEPNEKNYFTAQFLFSFKFPSEIKFRVEFIDSMCRKTWKAAATAILPISTREIQNAYSMRDSRPGYLHVGNLP